MVPRGGGRWRCIRLSSQSKYHSQFIIGIYMIMHLLSTAVTALGLVSLVWAAPQAVTTTITLSSHPVTTSITLSERPIAERPVQTPNPIMLLGVPTNLPIEALKRVTPQIKVFLEMRPDIDRRLASEYPNLSNDGRIDIQRLIDPPHSSNSQPVMDNTKSAFSMLNSLGSIVYGGLSGLLNQERGYVNSIFDALGPFIPSVAFVDGTIAAATPTSGPGKM